MLPEVVRQERGIVVVADDRPREELAISLIAALRGRGWRVRRPTGWEDYDARLLLGLLIFGDLQTSSYPEGFVQIRIRFRARRRAVAVAATTTTATLLISPLITAVVAGVLVAGIAKVAIRTRRLLNSILPAEAR